MKTIRVSRQRLRQVNKPCSQSRHKASHEKGPTVEEGYQLHSVINAIQDGIRVMDTELIIRLQNETTRRMSKGREEIGLPCYQVHYGRKEPCDNCHALEAMKTGELVKKKEVFQSDDYDHLVHEVFAYPFKNSAGDTVGVVEYFRDITPHVLMERQMTAINHIGLLANSSLELEEVLTAILESTTRLVNTSVGMIFIKDPHTGLFTWGASQGLSDAFVTDYMNTPIHPGEGLTGTIGQTGKAIYVPTV